MEKQKKIIQKISDLKKEDTISDWYAKEGQWIDTVVTDSEKIKEKWKKYTARKIWQQPRFLQRYCVPYLEESLVIEDEVTSTLSSLPS